MLKSIRLSSFELTVLFAGIAMLPMFPAFVPGLSIATTAGKASYAASLLVVAVASVAVNRRESTAASLKNAELQATLDALQTNVQEKRPAAIVSDLNPFIAFASVAKSVMHNAWAEFARACCLHRL
jgi:hypothetical protein